MTARKTKRRLDDWPPIGLRPIVMQRQVNAEKNHEAVRAWGADRIVEYTRATLDSTFLALHLKLHQPTTPAMEVLLADILTGKVKAKLRPKKKWLSPDALAVYRHWHDVIRAKLEEGDPDYEKAAKLWGGSVNSKGERTKAAWLMTATMYGISPREAEKIYWSKSST